MKHLKFFILLCVLTFATSCGQQKKYIEYKVKKGETMRVIAKKLDMKTKDLLRLNPDVGRRPEENTVIIIPNKKINNSKEEIKEVVTEEVKEEPKVDDAKKEKEKLIEELKKQFVIYEVKKGDTFYSLTRFYNVSQVDLVSLNPKLSEGLKTGQIIKIKPVENKEDIIENTIYEDVISEDVSLKVGLLLPFKASEFDSITYKKIFSNSRLANIVTDFYLGAEIAIDSLKNQGVNIDLSIYDTGKNSTKIRTILEENDLNENDVLIGPLYSEEANIVANKVKVPVVFPVYSKNQSKFSSSKLIKTSPEKNVFREELSTYIKDNFNNGTLIVVGDGKSDSNRSSSLLKSSLESSDSISKVHVLKPKDGYIEKELFLKILKPNTKNWVVMATNDNVIVADALNSLISLPDSTSVNVFAFDKGRAYDRIDNRKLAAINFTYVSDSYVDESSITTKVFNKQYFKRNNALPSFYATKGFDITYDILIRLASGNKLKSTFKEGASFRVETKFDYNNKLFGVSENKGLFIVQYNKDLSLTRLK